MISRQTKKKRFLGGETRTRGNETPSRRKKLSEPSKSQTRLKKKRGPPPGTKKENQEAGETAQKTKRRKKCKKKIPGRGRDP